MDQTDSSYQIKKQLN